MNASEYTYYFHKYADDVYRVVLSYCKDIYDAEDIMQNTFLKFYRETQPFQDEVHVKKWLITVAVNESRNLFHSIWKRRVGSIEDEREEPVFSMKEHSDLYEAVHTLPRNYRIVIHLYYYEGYSVKEISEILGVRQSTIQTRLMRGRAKLRKMLEDDQNETETVSGNI